MTRPDLREVVLVEEDDLETAGGDALVDVGEWAEDARPWLARRGSGRSRSRPGWVAPGGAPVDLAGGGPVDRAGAVAGEGTGGRSGWRGVGRRRGAARGGGGDRGDGRRGGRGPRGVVIGAVLGVLVATGAVVDGAQERALQTRLADVQGLLAPLGPDVQELWRRPAGWGQLATIGGDLVLGRKNASGADELVGIAGATGEEQWVAPIPELTETGEIWCESFGDADRHLTTAVACRVIPSQGREIFGRRFDEPSATRAVLFVIDPRTGERVLERTLDSQYPTLESLGDDLVLVEVDDDGHVRVTASEPVSGEERWTFRSDDPLPATGRLRETPIPVLRHDVLLLTGATGWALSRDGDLLGEWDLRGAQLPLLGGRPGTDTLTVLPDGRFAVARPGAGSARPGRYGTVSATGTTEGFAIPGPVVEPVVDDGSATDVVLTTQAVAGELSAQDARTGERLWTHEGGLRGDALVLDRRLVTLTGDDLVALDPRSGDTLWTVPLGGGRLPRLLTDGHLVLAGLQGGGTRELVAWGVDDGRERWRAPLPPDAEALRIVGGRLLAFSEDHVFALGPPLRHDDVVDDAVDDAADDAGDDVLAREAAVGEAAARDAAASTGRTAAARLP